MRDVSENVSVDVKFVLEEVVIEGVEDEQVEV